MIGIEITAEKKSDLVYQYTALYGRANTDFPKNREGVPIVGRDNESCDSLIERVVKDIGNQRYILYMGDGMNKEDGERIRKYILDIRKKR